MSNRYFKLKIMAIPFDPDTNKSEDAAQFVEITCTDDSLLTDGTQPAWEIIGREIGRSIAEQHETLAVTAAKLPDQPITWPKPDPKVHPVIPLKDLHK